MKDILDQGAVLYGIRAEKYSDVKCYGIVITASCDIAQRKVSKVYYLIGVDAKDWFCSNVGFQHTYECKIKSLGNNLKNQLKLHKLDADLLINFQKEEIEQVVLSEVKKQADAKKIIQTCLDIQKFSSAVKDIEFRHNAIKSDTAPINKFLSEVSKGKVLHYYFLPQDAYLGNRRKDAGLIIDLQEIGYMSIGDAQRIISPGIDFQCLSEEEREWYNTSFWLESEDDFVYQEGAIQSPWREHLMQRFSNGFIRIGLDDATDEDYHQLANSIWQED